ncbi:MAG: nucleotide pyrophosphohydrolase [Candidatus Gracilibacteria bacterium]
MKTINELTEKIVTFRDLRDWKQFHNPKDMALSLMLEAGEVMEHFQWKDISEMDEYIKTNSDDIGEELADVLYWVLLMSHDLKIDIFQSLQKKLKKNELKYPVDKSKGKHSKYNQLGIDNIPIYKRRFFKRCTC